MKPREFFDLVVQCRQAFHDFTLDRDKKHMDRYFFYAKQIDEEILRVQEILKKGN